MHLPHLLASLLTLTSTALALGPACVGQPNCPDYRCPGPQCPYNVPGQYPYPKEQPNNNWPYPHPRYRPNRSRYHPQVSCGGIEGPCPNRRPRYRPQVSCGGIDGPCRHGRDPYYYPNRWHNGGGGGCGSLENPCPTIITPIDNIDNVGDPSWLEESKQGNPP